MPRKIETRYNDGRMQGRQAQTKEEDSGGRGNAGVRHKRRMKGARFYGRDGGGIRVASGGERKASGDTTLRRTEPGVTLRDGRPARRPGQVLGARTQYSGDEAVTTTGTA